MSVTTPQANQEAQQTTITPASSKASTWINRVLIVVVLVAIPVLYYFGYIGVVWLNRIGIILNFCAGFMVAPELLGVSRLHRIEVFIKQVLRRLRRFTIANRRISPAVKLMLFGYMTIFIVDGFILFTLRLNANTTLPDYIVKLAPIAMIVASFVIGAILATFLVAVLIDYASKELAGNERLRSILVWWGIIFFIVGNLLQFISTF
jgi:hypothetical protein